MSLQPLARLVFMGALGGAAGGHADDACHLDEATRLMAEFLFGVQEDLIQDRAKLKTERANPFLSALTFVAHTAGATLMQKVLSQHLVQDFRKSPFVRRDRAEALPFFLALAFAFEYRVMSESAPISERLILGSIVFAGARRFAFHGRPALPKVIFVS